ncbi:MAG: signal peptidase II [Liquorilactobacillus nagelii]|jgi:signal peptidase II|uniref:signal peptidase II n=1 Tax=Liquorilactobacillus nagelii TaxID=82688 RepID=UPI0006EF78B6|nr:signal peptidase II [Liquorilactobacillus nagelii]KRL41451.1 lipoprotein signal peptidase [Liquorilactobacillus nagelii DSM 13675]MCI1632871.1 signal peptidase II [Liquorilactobacillus nagelii]MCI1700264.1 signal peptidase II [Liquorilactobacillus nagelii]MCI1921991.1 signal peptidase II [Liquorilactobacillus nagelii]MCI1977745.1 signal peptidase II [Liquorilactobacillus nagelii]
MPIYFLLMAAVVLLDQLVKFYVTHNIPLNTSVNVISHVLALAHIRNYGAAWNILTGQQLFFFVITIAALVVLGYLFKKNWSNWLYALGISLMIGGTLGNFVDRLRIGYVVDMFELKFINFPVFNVADAALSVGVVILLIAILRDDRHE